MKTILSLTALLAVTTIAFAAEGEKGKGEAKRDPEAMFKALDSNSDGSISKEEWDASRMAKNNPERAAKGFTARDKDADGKLSKEEFAAAGRKGAK